MADQDLEDLINEMNFNTPLHGNIGEVQQSGEEKVLISDRLLTVSNPDQLFQTYIPLERPTTNMGSITDELITYSPGTSSHKTRI